MRKCKNCDAELDGELIYETFLKKYKNEQKALETAEMYGATKTKGRWKKEIGIYDIYTDRTVKFRCPECGYEWPRMRKGL